MRFGKQHSFEQKIVMFPQVRRGSLRDPRVRTRTRLDAENNRAPFQWSNIVGPYNANQYSGEYVFTVTSRGVLPNGLRLGDVTQYEQELEALFDRILSYVVNEQGIVDNDLVQMVISSNLHVWTPLLHLRHQDGGSFLTLIENALDSNEVLYFEGATVTVRYYRQQRPRGGSYASASEFVNKKKSIVKIYSNVNCFWVGLALGDAEWNKKELYASLVGGGERRTTYQIACGKTMKERCGWETDSITFKEIPEIEEKVQLSILVVDYEGMRIRYSSDKFEKQICLLFIPNDEGGHFHYVKKDYIGQLWEKSKFCKMCKRGYANNRHKCIKKCRACKSPDCEGAEASGWSAFNMKCNLCRCSYFDEKCYQKHKRKQCKTYTLCEDCKFLYESEEIHVCNHRKCSNCGELVSLDEEHNCYHQPLKKKDLPKPTEKYIYYDYETFLDEKNQHVTVAIVAMKHDSEEVFKFHTTSEFVTWLLVKDHKGYTCIAHNSGRYDFHFIKRELLERSIQTNDVCNGNTIFYSVIPKWEIRFIDSYRLISISLRGFPKAFGIKEMSKGYFPYRFLRQETRGYIGPIPEIEWFDFDHLKEKDKEDALKWYEGEKDKEFHLMERCWEYCVSDVLLLKEGCSVFREKFMSITNQEVDPLQFITIASVCMAIYRRFYLPEQSIGVIEQISEDHLYKKQLWKRYTEHTLNGPVPETMQYNICVDNGCQKCFKPYTKHPKSGIFMKDLYYHALERDKNKQVIWEHDFILDSKIKEFEEKYFVYEENHINMRDAFFGGRTEPIKLYKKCERDERMRYYDFTSLYPSVQFGKLRGVTQYSYNNWQELEYPCGQPVHIDYATPHTLNQFFGFVKCDIEPPEDLHLPILPEKKNGKLMFDLTKKIAKTWTIKEVLLAQKYGYKITKIYDVLHFPERRSDLFREYVLTFYKLKLQATGWKALGIMDPVRREVYCEELRSTYGMPIQVLEIPEDKNPGMYLITKLCLNSLWGKFGQRDNFTNTVDVFSWSEFQEIVDLDDIEITGVVLHGAKVRTLTYKKLSQFVSAPKYTNIAVAAFTTAHARCRLYEALSELPPNSVVYMDTDSVIYVEKYKYNRLKTGPFLGDLTDELEDSDYITEFVSTGPKSYAYLTSKGKEEVKVKGITLNCATKRKLDFETMKEMTQDPTKRVLTKPLQFIINQDHTITTKQLKENEGKVFKLTMNKRKIDFENESEFELNTQPFKK